MGEIIDFTKYALNKKLDGIKERWRYTLTLIHSDPNLSVTEKGKIMCEVGEMIDRLEEIKGGQNGQRRKIG